MGTRSGSEEDPVGIPLRQPKWSRRRGFVVAIAALIAAVAVLGGLLTWRDRQDHDCESIPVVVTVPGADASSELSVSDVVVELSRSSMGWDGVTLVVGASGEVIAVDDHGPSAPSYRRAALAKETVSGLRRCLDSTSFQNLASTYTNQSGSNPNGGFCALADASTYLIAAGPAAATAKKITVYALDPNIGGECRLDRPAALLALFGSLERMRSEAVKAGVPTNAPTPVLGPR